MADQKISALASGAPAQAGDEYVVARSGANYKLTLTNIAASMPATTITSGNLTFSSTAQRITGDFSNATYSNRVAFQTSTASSNTLIPILNTQASNGASVFQFYNNNDTTNNSFAQIGIGGSALQLVSGQNGTGSYFPIVMSTGGSERMRIDTAGKITDQYGNIRAIPRTGSAKTTSYSLATTDVGLFVEVGSGGSVTIPDATFATGDVVSVFNNTSGNITITCTITTAYIAGTDSDKATVTLATRGVATILFLSGTVCVINGNVS
jgi:hypothetical protein